MNRQYKHIIGWVILLLLSACQNIALDNETEKDALVFLSITRAQTAESINADGVDFEDRVHDLAMLVFDSNSGEKVCEYFDGNSPSSTLSQTFTVKMKSGLRDFYFVANMPLGALMAIADKNQLETYIKAKNTLNDALYNGAETERGFPMSRIYRNQFVNRGGTITNPLPFTPAGEGNVKLERAVAKIEVTLPAGESGRVASMKYCNSAKQFSLLSQSETYAAGDFATKDFVLKEEGRWVVYTPEISFTTQPPAWNGASPGFINYIELTTIGGSVYAIPVVHNAPAGNNYMRFARKEIPGQESPNFNVLRNNHYMFSLSNIPADPEYDLTVKYEVVMWTPQAITIPPFE